MSFQTTPGSSVGRNVRVIIREKDRLFCTLRLWTIVHLNRKVERLRWPGFWTHLDQYNLKQVAHLCRLQWSCPKGKEVRMYLFKNQYLPTAAVLSNVIRTRDINFIQFSSSRSSQSDRDIDIMNKQTKRSKTYRCSGKQNSLSLMS